MQQVLRPLTSGIAIASTGLIALGPVAPSPADAQLRAVQLAADVTYADLVTDTMANLQHIADGADWQAIADVFGAIFTNPLGVLNALTDVTPDVTTDLTTLPASVSVQLPPGLALGIADLSAIAATADAIHDVTTGLTSGDSSGAFGALINAVPNILNAYLNGQDNIELLGGIITIPGFNGILAPEQSLEVNLDLTKLLDALGLADLKLDDLGVDLNGLLDDLLGGNLNLGELLDDLGLGDKGLGDLLGNPTLDQLLGDLGLGGLGLGSFSLTGVLSGLGLDTDVDLNSLSLDSVLSAFGLDPTVDVGLGSFLQDVGLGDLLDTSLGDLLGGLPGGLLDTVTDALNTVLSGILNGLTGIPGLGGILDTLLDKLVLTPGDVIGALNNVTVGDLLGGQSINDTLGTILTALGVSDVTPEDLTVGGLLEDLGFSSSTGDLTLGGLLGDLGLGGTPVGDLLNTLDLGGLFDMLGLSDLDLDLNDLVGDLTNLDLGGLLDDLGLTDVDLADISVDPFGGLLTELFDTAPQQILDALG